MFSGATSIIETAKITIVVTILIASPTKNQASVLPPELADDVPKENITKMIFGTIKAKPHKITE